MKAHLSGNSIHNMLSIPRCSISVLYLLMVLMAIPANAIVPAVAIHVPDSGVGCFSAPELWKSFHTVRFLEESLKSDGTPLVKLSGSQIEGGGLLEAGSPKYPILFSIGTECVTDGQLNQIRTFASAGGTVFGGASSWTRNSNGSIRTTNGQPAFGLGPEMGLTPSGWTYIREVTPGVMTPSINHLTGGTTYQWHVAFSYDALNFDPRHLVFGARPSTTSPAEVNLWGIGSAGFMGSFPAPPPLANGIWNDSKFSIQFANVDGDVYGREDLVYRVADTVFVRRSTGAGFAAPVPWTFWNTAFDFTIADVNGDGKADIVGRSGDNVQVGLSTGTGFSPSTQWTTWSPAYDYRLADVNGDGKADIVGRSGIDIQVGLSTGSAFSPSTGWTTWSTSYEHRLADVNGDGKADIVGRMISGIDVQVGLSTGSGFSPSTSWTTWGTSYDYQFADVNGDGRRDIIGRAGSDVQVGLSTGTSFESSTAWTGWSPNFTLSLADVDGDGKRDAVGCKCNTSADNYPPGDIEVGISTGLVPGTSVNSVKLSRKAYGSGLFLYDSALVSLAGYGGAANDNSEYKIIRSAVVEAFARRSVPLVTLAPWPFQYQSAMIFRHDHWLASDVHEFEKTFSTGKFGEYYLMPEQAGSPQPSPCSASPQIDNYNQYTTTAVNNRAIIGAHLVGHVSLDSYDSAGALAQLVATRDRIQSETGGLMSPAFVAPAYFAIKQSSMQAIANAGFVTTGEQGVGPFPHFSLDPESSSGYIGSLLQLPTSEWPGMPVQTSIGPVPVFFDNIERMVLVSGTPGPLEWAAKLSFDLGGLINVYDHVGGDPYGYGLSVPGFNPCQDRLALATRLLNYVKNTLDQNAGRVWYANSLDLRQWWLQRDRRQTSSSVSRPNGSTTVITTSIAVASPLASTTFPDTDTALRLSLDTTSQAQTSSGVRVSLDGTQVSTSCAGTQFVRCSGSDLYVKIGAATNVVVQLGN